MSEQLIEDAQRIGASRELAERVAEATAGGSDPEATAAGVGPAATDPGTPGLMEIAIGVGRVMAVLDTEAAHRYLAADFIDHEASDGVGGGPEGYLATARYMHAAFADASWAPEDFFATADGDKYAVRVRFRGTHRGEFLGIAPTGRAVDVAHLHFYRVEGGKVAEHWGARDELTMLQQLGVITPTHANPADAGAGRTA